MSCLKCLPMSSANLSKEITWCLPGSTHCLSSSICLMGLMRSIWAGSQLCLSANVFLMRILLMSSRTELCVCQCLSSELSRCLPRSVSQCLLPNLSTGATWCLSGSTQSLSSSICLMGLMRSVWAGSQLCLSANVFLMRILLMSFWTELCVCQCLSSELSRCLPLSVSQCLSPNLSKEPLDVFLDQPNVCLMGLIGVLTELALTCLSASIYGENPADVCLDWIHLFSCQCLWGWIQSMSAKSFFLRLLPNLSAFLPSSF